MRKQASIRSIPVALIAGERVWICLAVLGTARPKDFFHTALSGNMYSSYFYLLTTHQLIQVQPVPAQLGCYINPPFQKPSPPGPPKVSRAPAGRSRQRSTAPAFHCPLLARRRTTCGSCGWSCELAHEVKAQKTKDRSCTETSFRQVRGIVWKCC